MSARVLLVEDEESIREAIKLNLEMEGYAVDIAVDGKKAVQSTRGKHYDLIILDVMLPEMDGFAVCEAIRLENSQVPILFLTAKSSGEDRIMGLKKGADDYLPKPFNLEELLLRVNNLIKRSLQSRNPQAVVDEYMIGSNKINFITYEIITENKEKIPLTKKEILLLKLLIERKNQVVSRETILNRVWGYDVYPTTRTIDNFILKFRKYFETDPHNPRHFHSVRGVGYKYMD